MDLDGDPIGWQVPKFVREPGWKIKQANLNFFLGKQEFKAEQASKDKLYARADVRG